MPRLQSFDAVGADVKTNHRPLFAKFRYNGQPDIAKADIASLAASEAEPYYLRHYNIPIPIYKRAIPSRKSVCGRYPVRVCKSDVSPSCWHITHLHWHVVANGFFTTSSLLQQIQQLYFCQNCQCSPHDMAQLVTGCPFGHNSIHWALGYRID